MKDNPGNHANILFRIIQYLHSDQDINIIISKILEETTQAIGAERGFILFVDQAGNLDYQKVIVFNENGDDNNFEIPSEIVENVCLSGESILIKNASEDHRFKNLLNTLVFQLKSILCVPIMNKKKTIGVMYLDNRKDAGYFTLNDQKFTQAVALDIGLAIDNSRLYEVALEKGRMERELQMARDVQRNLIPAEIPAHEGWDIAVCWNPAFEVSGDFYDFIPIANKKLGFVIADVSDKGLPAALFMALSRTIMRAVALNGKAPAEKIAAANKLIITDAKERMYISAVYGELDLEEGVFTYVNAGHNPPWHFNKQAQKYKQLKPTGMVIGVDPLTTYEQKTIDLANGDFIVFYTDGVIDAAVEDHTYSDQALQLFIKRHRNTSARQIVKLLSEKLSQKERHNFDDLTLMVVKRTM